MKIDMQETVTSTVILSQVDLDNLLAGHLLIEEVGETTCEGKKMYVHVRMVKDEK